MNKMTNTEKYFFVKKSSNFCLTNETEKSTINLHTDNDHSHEITWDSWKDYNKLWLGKIEFIFRKKKCKFAEKLHSFLEVRFIKAYLKNPRQTI